MKRRPCGRSSGPPALGAPARYTIGVAKSNAIEEALAALKALRGQPPSDDVKRQLIKGLESKANLVAARSAELVLEFRLPDLAAAMQRSFERFLTHPKVQD